MHTPPTVLTAGLLLAGSLTSAVPTLGKFNELSNRATDASEGAGPTTAEEIILRIMPTSSSCAGAKQPAQCRTAAEAAPFFIQAMSKYELYNSWEIATVLSLTAMESAELKFKVNQAHSSTGQGTSNMQMRNFNIEFARSIPELQAKVDAIIPSGTPPESSTDDQGARVLDLVTDDKYNFQSGAWFMATKCGTYRAALRQGQPDAWLKYNLDCVGVGKEPTDAELNDQNRWLKNEWAKRREYWANAMAAFGLKYSS